MELEDATNPVAVDDTADATVTDDAGVNTDEELAEEEIEEVELDDDLKLELPKSQAAKLRELKEGNLRQADYTRKTQELAEQRKALEAERYTVQEASQQELQARAHLAGVENALANYQNIDFVAAAQSAQYALQQAQASYDDEGVQRAMQQIALIQTESARVNQLQRTRDQLAGNLSHAEATRHFHAQQDFAKRMEEGRAQLADIGYSDDLRAKLVGFAKEYGYADDELADMETDPRAVRLLHAAFKGAGLTKAQKLAEQQQVQPAAKVGGRSAPPAGLDDRLSADEWMRRRNAQLAKKG